jgi:lipoprotein NlpI
MRFGLFGTTVLAGAFFVIAGAEAQLAQQWQSCTGKSGVDWKEQVQSCTILIQSSYETMDHRVIALIRRGIAYNNEGEPDKALVDYNEAITLEPKSAQAYYNRGNAYWSTGDNARAIADFDKTIELNPKDASAYRGRGLASLYAGNPAKASADLGEASKLDPKDAYNALWVDIAGQRSNTASHLAEAASQINMTAWPAPVIRMFLGQATPAAVVAAAETADDKTKTGEVCEANFYSGEWALRTGAKEEATRLFRLAANACPKDFLEWGAANAELKTLGAAH